MDKTVYVEDNSLYNTESVDTVVLLFFLLLIIINNNQIIIFLLTFLVSFTSDWNVVDNSIKVLGSATQVSTVLKYSILQLALFYLMA
ncbi:uncharacterized protein OCT59_017004 [Rhizophagus irregularis]|uniref:uncharacterized protein n=1 Tax=Rhizophagus irregularis TaxID=588596 RepID=UPI00332EA001|nr:hypothetical protein OCT59_017004 [Rhizophagus irregularis]